MTVEQLAKIDSREVYEDNEYYTGCECDANAACGNCIDNELYGAITTTQQGQLPPPPFILLDNVWNEEDERAMHALTHCENEQACTFCNEEK